MHGIAEVRGSVLLRLEETGLIELRWERFPAQYTRDMRDCGRDELQYRWFLGPNSPLKLHPGYGDRHAKTGSVFPYIAESKEVKG